MTPHAWAIVLKPPSPSDPDAGPDFYGDRWALMVKLLPTFDPSRASLWTYFIHAWRRHRIDARRRHAIREGSRPHLQAEYAASSPAPEPPSLPFDPFPLLERALAPSPFARRGAKGEAIRAAILAHYRHGIPLSVCASLHSIPVGTLKSALYRTLLRARILARTHPEILNA